MRTLVAGILSPFLCLAVEGQNSARQVRPEPSATAARAGSAVAWRPSLAAARAESRELGVPVFWYVPTVAGSPMDRRVEIDRYMMAGPFSHPDVVALLNHGFVPVRQAGDRQAGRELGLRLGGLFVEPGFVVEGADGVVTLRAHRISTLHPSWFLARLRPRAASRPAPRQVPERLAEAWRAYAAGDVDRAEELIDSPVSERHGSAFAAESRFLAGAIQHRLGRADLAEQMWRDLAGAFPDEPFAWKAAAEAEGHGPFARGFEDFLEVAEKALGHESTTRAPLGAYTEDELRRLGLRFLTSMQRPAGHYTDSWYDFGGTDGLPNVFMAVTAIVGSALLEELSTPEQVSDREACERALGKILAYVSDHAAVNDRDRDEIVWAHAYRVLLLSRWLELRPHDGDRVRPVLVRVVEDLQGLTSPSGAWFHEYPNPFTTATVLIALSRARGAGIEVDDDRVSRGVKALLQCRAENGAYSYGQQSRKKTTGSVPGSAGRMPLCELGIALWRGGEAGDLEGAVRAAFDHHDQLERVRKYDDHAGALGYGGFFFWYDMHGRTIAIQALRDPELRREMAERQREIILSIPEFDGCFVDSHELGRVYGTASALWCLAVLRGH